MKLAHLTCRRGAGWLAAALFALAVLPGTAMASAAQRIVSIGGPVTETVFALGQQRRLVAVDTTSTYPVAAGKLPNVGYLRALAAEGILSLKPDLVIASNEAGPAAVLQQLRDAGVRVEIVATGPDAASALKGMGTVADLLGQHAQGQALVARVRKQLDALATQVAQYPHKPRVLFVLGGQGGQPLIAGKHTKAAHMLALAGAVNVADSFSGYRPGGAEALIKLAPEVILMASHGVPGWGSVDEMLDQTGLRMTPAGQHERVIVMDTVLLLGMGPRLGDAASELAQRLHQAPAMADSTKAE